MIQTNLFRLIVVVCFSILYHQVAYSQKDSAQEIGVAISPSHITFNLKPGASKSYEIKVNNETSKKRSFKISMKDFNMNDKGNVQFIKPGEGEYSLSKWLSLSPTFVEVPPFSSKNVKVTLTLPETPEAEKAAWALVMVEEAKEREKLEPEGNKDKISLGVIPMFAFGVYIYQNPPNVKNNKVEIKNFVTKLDSTGKVNALDLTLKNAGDGISFCTSYIELTHLKTGKQQRLLVKRFTILPSYKRDYLFKLPEKLEKGKYSAVGVLDFGSKDEIEAAEIEFELK